MFQAAKRLFLAVILIVLTSSVLLLSDWKRRRPGLQEIPSVAVVQLVSDPIVDKGVDGILKGLAGRGFVDGQGLHIRRYNAQGDMGNLNAIAREVTTGDFEMILTVTTPCLQAVANANQAGKSVHVFGMVTDPFIAGVGLNRENPLEHPPHLVGIGTFEPVEADFHFARKLYSELKVVGAVWNPAEANSQACMERARAICGELGIELLEANVANSSDVLEAAISLVARGSEALWIGGDNTANIAFEAVLSAARKGRIPVFTSNVGSAERGALFDLGPDYHQVGMMIGDLAGSILAGTDPETIAIKDVVPEQVMVNKLALIGLKDPWQLTTEVLAASDFVIDEGGTHRKTAVEIPRPPEGRVFRIGLVYFAPEPGADSCMKGLFDGLRELGFEEGRNLEVLRSHAQGEIVNIPQILQNFDSQGLDLIVPMTTPCLTAACTTVRQTPVVFTYVYDPIAAGAGKTFEDHLPLITGVGSFPPVEETIEVIQSLVPNLRVVGTLYNSSEANSRKVISVARELFHQKNIVLEEVAITSTSEVFQAAQVLTARGIQAIWITGDNTALQAFSGIVKVAMDAKLPLIINDPEFVQEGALMAVGIGWYQTGLAASRAVARVLLGESPQQLPFENVAVKQIVLNDEVARRLGITFPEELKKEASREAADSD